MRIRLTLDIQRAPKPAPAEPEPPVGYEFAQAHTEHAGPQRIGFTIPAPVPEEDV